jgi:hypothetical protein
MIKSKHYSENPPSPERAKEIQRTVKGFPVAKRKPAEINWKAPPK